MIRYESIKVKSLSQIVNWIETRKKHSVCGTQFEIVFVREIDGEYVEAIIKIW